MAHDAFISYSHAADRALAPVVESGLEKLAKPWLKLRAIDVFRDETALAANPHLWNGIVEHLQVSTWFVLMASPESAASPWCLKEAQWWLDNRGPDRMLILLTGGDIAWEGSRNDFDWTRTTSLSRGLGGRLTDEPLYVDLRWARGESGLALGHPRFRQAILDIAAPIRGVPKDQLDGEDVRQLQRGKRIAQAGAASITVLFLASVLAGWQAVNQRAVAEAQRDVALSRQLAAQSASALETKPDLALLLAREAVLATAPGPPGLWRRLGLRREERPLAEAATFEARSALLAALTKTDGVHALVIKPETQFYHVAFTADGARLVLAIVGDRVFVVDTATWQLKAGLELPDHYDLASSFGRLSSDARRAAVRDSRVKGRIVVLDLDTGRIIGQPLDGHRDYSLVALSADGRVLVAEAEGGGMKIWDVDAAVERRSPIGVGPERIYPAAVTADARHAVAATEGGQLSLWDLTTGRPIVTALATVGAPAVAFSPDGRTFAVYGPGEKYLVLRATATGRETARLAMDGNWASTLAFDPSGRFLAAAMYGGDVRLWDLQDEEPEPQTLRLGPQQVNGLVFSPDGKLLVVATPGGRVIAWDLTTRQSLSTTVRRGAGFGAVAFKADGSLLAAAGTGSIRLFDVSTRTVSGQLPLAQGDVVLSLDFSSDGSYLASAHRDQRKVSLWNLATRAAASIPFTDDVLLARFSPDGRTLAVHTDGAKAITLWDTESRELIGTLDGVHTEPVTSIAFAHRQPLVASAGFDRQVVIWSLPSRRPIGPAWKFQFSATEPPDIVWSANDQLLLTNTLEVRSAKDGRPVEPSRSYGVFAVTADAKRVAIGKRDIQLWHVHGNRWTETTLPSDGDVFALAFSPDGRLLASAGGEGLVRLWDVDVASWIAKACRIANRNLTRLEWADVRDDAPYRLTCPQLPEPPPERRGF